MKQRISSLDDFIHESKLEESLKSEVNALLKKSDDPELADIILWKNGKAYVSAPQDAENIIKILSQKFKNCSHNHDDGTHKGDNELVIA